MQKIAFNIGRTGGMLSGALAGGLAGYNAVEPENARSGAIIGALTGAGLGRFGRGLFNKYTRTGRSPAWRMFARYGQKPALKVLAKNHGFVGSQAPYIATASSVLPATLGALAMTDLAGLHKEPASITSNRRLERAYMRQYPKHYAMLRTAKAVM